MNSNKKENNNINYIQIMNIPEGNNFFSNNFNPKSKLYTYKKIKIPKISKKLNHSGKTESVNSSKCEEKSSNPSFNSQILIVLSKEPVIIKSLSSFLSK